MLKEKLVCNWKQFAYHFFLWIGTMLAFFQSLAKISATSEFWKINVSEWAIESAQILIIVTEIRSWPCALLTSKALISFITSLLPKQSFDMVLCRIWYFRRQDTTAWDQWALFCKKRVKNSFFLKFRNKFTINKQWMYDRNFFTIVKGFQYRTIGFIT